MKVKNKKQAEQPIRVLLGLPDRIKILGFYKGIPIIHDPKYPTPDGIMYFINIKIKKFYQTKKSTWYTCSQCGDEYLATPVRKLAICPDCYRRNYDHDNKDYKYQMRKLKGK